MAGKRSPVFEMHGQYPGWSQTLAPGASGTLRVLFDPGVHDHGKEQPVIQGVFIYTDDADKPEAVAKVIARVEG